VTAAHCVNAKNDPHGPAINCNDLAFIFDYKINANGRVPDQYDSDQVYFCEQVLDNNSFADADWRVLKLDRHTRRTPLPILDRLPMNLKRFQVANVGHPLGLPLKAATNGRTRDRHDDSFFIANIDAFEGNSGSPVVIQIENRPIVIGLLASGETDFVEHQNKKCKTAKSCSEDNCRGEHVISSSRFASWSSNSNILADILANPATVLPACF